MMIRVSINEINTSGINLSKLTGFHFKLLLGKAMSNFCFNLAWIIYLIKSTTGTAQRNHSTCLYSQEKFWKVAG
jgi:hypothetical protein